MKNLTATADTPMQADEAVLVARLGDAADAEDAARDVWLEAGREGDLAISALSAFRQGLS
jgi:hypothetical protein